MALHPLDRFGHIAETTDTARISNFAGAPSDCNVFAHTLNRVRHASVPNLSADSRFRFAEAITDCSLSCRFLLPHRNPKIIFSEHMSCVVEVNNGAFGVCAETIRAS